MDDNFDWSWSWSSESSDDDSSSFGGYDVPGTLGGLGQGYVSPNLMYDFNLPNGFGKDEESDLLSISLTEVRSYPQWKNYLMLWWSNILTNPTETELNRYGLRMEDLVYLSPCKLMDIIEDYEYNHLTDSRLNYIQQAFVPKELEPKPGEEEHENEKFITPDDPDLYTYELE